VALVLVRRFGQRFPAGWQNYLNLHVRLRAWLASVGRDNLPTGLQNSQWTNYTMADLVMTSDYAMVKALGVNEHDIDGN